VLSLPQLILLKTGEEGEKLTTAKVRDQYKYIPLTDEDEAYSLLDAYKKKALKLAEEEKEAESLRRKESIKSMWTFEECANFAYSRGKDIGNQRGFDFVVDEKNKEVFDLLAMYFSNDKRFEQKDYFGKKYSLKKGICLLSPIRGNGKTTLLDCFMWNKRGCYAKKSTKAMCKEYEKYGLDHVEKFMWLLPAPNNASNFYQDFYGIHFDDFGDEQEVMHMGNRRLISSMIVNNIYDEHRDENLFWRFHISMNYKWSEFEAKYGTNGASRMEEMFNLVPLPGDSRR